MIELTRFQLLRPVQTIAAEEAQQVGLPLYPDAALSDLVNSLKDADSDSAYTALLNRYREANKTNEITDSKSLNPVVLALYNWLNFKARPLKLEDFKNFVATLKSSDLPNPEDEWRHYADNLILAIERGLSSRRQYHGGAA